MSVYVCTSVHAHLYIRMFTCCRCNSWPTAKTAWRVRIMFSLTTFLPPMRTGVACRAIDASDATPSQQSGVRQCAWRHQGRGLRVALGQCSGSLAESHACADVHLFRVCGRRLLRVLSGGGRSSGVVHANAARPRWAACISSDRLITVCPSQAHAFSPGLCQSWRSHRLPATL